MRFRLAAILVLALAAFALAATTASARWYGSTLRDSPNAPYGCEAALTRAVLGGLELSPSNQSSCTYRHGGYLGSGRPTFLVPGSGRITRIRVKVGANPAKLRLVVLTGSTRVDPFTGRDQPGTYTCCTARRVGKAFRPKANAVTSKKVNVRVEEVREKELNYRIHSTDGLALSAEGPGSLPLHIRQSAGGFDSGTPIATGYWPATGKGDPRVDGYSMTGIDVLFQWDWRRR